jgi:hypothetical protein
MWAQYGDNSRGFCLILDKEQLGIRIKDLAADPSHLLPGNIDYPPWIELIEGGVELPYGEKREGKIGDVFQYVNQNSVLESVYFRKNIDWIGESEYRWLLFSETFEDIFVSIEGVVKAVVLGWKFPANQFSQAKTYCNALDCSCYVLQYQYPQYGLISI